MNDLISISKKIIDDRLTLDYFSKIYGTLIFRQNKDQISLEELNHIQKALIANGIFSQIQETPREYLLRVFAEYSKIKTEKRTINILLFFATFIAATLTGRFNYFENFTISFVYAFSIMLILTAHEMGHYLYAVKHRIYATLPYFIPFFIPFGTLGAFIKIKSPIPDKNALFEVGIAGPLAGFVLSVTFLIIGFSQLPDAEGVRDYVTRLHPWSDTGEGALTLGTSILFEYIRNVMGAGHLPMYEIYHFPFIFAGWIGLLVTALNLLPIGQLDGGHISYALFGKNSKYIAYAAFLAMVLLLFYSTNYIIWLILIPVVIRFKHPPTMNDGIEFDPKKKILAWSSYLIFITCFSPMPIYIS